MRPIDLVIFDCDGVLIDSEVISARVLVDEMAQQGIEIDHDYVVQNFLGRSYRVVFQSIRQDFGLSLPESFGDVYRKRLLDDFERELQIMPGVRAVLSALKPAFCLATSSSPLRVQRSLKIVGLDRLFEGRVTTASEVEHGKPAPDLMLRAAEKAGVPPSRVLVIEDSANGVLAAAAAQMEVWQFLGGSHLKGLDPAVAVANEADRTFVSFDEFFTLRADLKISDSEA